MRKDLEDEHQAFGVGEVGVDADPGSELAPFPPGSFLDCTQEVEKSCAIVSREEQLLYSTMLRSETERFAMICPG